MLPDGIPPSALYNWSIWIRKKAVKRIDILEYIDENDSDIALVMIEIKEIELR